MNTVIHHNDSLEMLYKVEGSYRVVNTARPVLDPSNPILAQALDHSPFVALADRRIASAYGDALKGYARARGLDLLDLLTTSGSEQDKTLAEVERIVDALSAAKLPRDGALLGFGGGVTLDVGGLVAAGYYRGIRYVRLATTLIAIVDVMVGVKQGVNQGDHKNRIGSFYPAAANIGDRAFLRSLGTEALAAGLAEVLKMAVIGDPELFDLVERWGRDLVASGFQDPPDVADEIIARAQLAMMRELAPNLYELDRRRKVDFGHTFSPVIEARSGYRLPHGHAVAIDMLLSTRLASRRGLCSSDVLDRLVATYRSVGLPLIHEACGLEILAGALDAGRRHRGALNLVVPTRVGGVTFVQEVGHEELAEAIGYLRALKMDRYRRD
jgi:2-epi-5-epi-valiolone synthase